MRVGRVAGYVVLLVAAATAAGASVRYAVDAELDLEARTIDGSLAIRLDNTARGPLRDLVLVLYPNRFALDDAADDFGIDDVNRPFVYPREELVPGGIAVEEVTIRDGDGAAEAPAAVREAVGPWAGTLLRIPLAAPPAPGASVEVRLRFRTLLPERFGVFGATDGRVTALGGWMPFLPRLAPGGTWDPYGPPLAGEVAGEIRVPAEMVVVADDLVSAAGDDARGSRTVTFAGAAPPGPRLVASARHRIHRRAAEATEVVLAELPSRYAFALPRREPHAAVVLDAIQRIVEGRAPELAAPARLVVAEAPLRLELTAPAGARVAVVSDRIFRVHRLLRELHERDLAAAIYGAMARETIARREDPDDVAWITEGVGAALADRYLAEVYPRHRTVDAWIDLLNVFAIVDRFESAPKIPFSQTFFPEGRRAEELRDGVEGLRRDRPPGRTILAKVENAIGADALQASVARYLAGTEPLRDAVAAVHGERLDWLFAQWTQSYPDLNYRVERVAPIDGGTRIEVARDASRPVRETVEVEVRGRGDERARLVWDDDRAQATFDVAAPAPARRTLLDPDRKLLEDTRADDARPPSAQVVLDSADVTVTSSEFGISGLFVARRRYDYTRDIGLVGFFSDRGVGMHLGPRWHFGRRIDGTRYRHNLYGFYTLMTLRGDFGDDSRPRFRTDGMLGGVGFRYDYTDAFAFDNPTSSTEVRVFGDWLAGALGSSFDYVDGGVRASLVRPLWTPRTLVAAQALNAFSAPVDGDRVPNQGRFSLGGDRAIRAIPVEERLGENVVLVRAELRQAIYPEIDHNLFDFLVVRRGQLRLFVDAGRVENRRSSLYRVSDFAVGAGVGFAAVYDFMGFYPAVAYVAVARRLDHEAGETNDVQFLFGTRQSF